MSRALLFLLWLAAACSASDEQQSQAADDISRGTGSSEPLSESDLYVLDLPLGIDSAQVRAQLGTPDSIHHWASTRGHASSNWAYGGISLFFDPSGIRQGAVLLDSTAATPRGLRVGDSISRLVHLYGAPTLEESADSWRYMSPDDPWIAMRVLIKEDRVVWLYLGRMDPNEIPD